MISNYKKFSDKDGYLEKLNDEVRSYFKILSPVFPDWLLDYINTPAMRRIDEINLSCGTCYSKIYNPLYWYSNLDHSVGVALIVWHFTQDKTQTLAALFHDIATPVFKHCIDFMNGDSEKQESTEERTEQIIQDSREINQLLLRDGIEIDKVCNYHDYPIADNDMPRLSADRLEYTFSSGLSFFRIWELEDIGRFYNDLAVLKNEDGIEELGFTTPKLCEEYMNRALKLWPEFVSDADRTVMQFLADVVKSAILRGFLTVDDLYVISEEEVIRRIREETDDYISLGFSQFANAETVYSSNRLVCGKYCTSVKGKKRYINPLVVDGEDCKRIRQYSASVDTSLKNFIDQEQSRYTGFEFDFVPYGK